MKTGKGLLGESELRSNVKAGFTPYQQWTAPGSRAILERKSTSAKVCFRRSRFNCGTGFTLAEILIVTVIIGILASLILPRFTGQTERAKAAEAISIMSTIRRGLLAYYDEHNDWPADADMADLPTIGTTLNTQFAPPSYSWTFSTAGGFNITATNDPSGTLTLNAQTGQWGGTDKYASDGEYFPYLPR